MSKWKEILKRLFSLKVYGMSDIFSLHPVWDEKQLEALNAGPNTIISGCAGSGKTLIAIHLAKWLYKESESPILILVYTTALRTFIKQTLQQLSVSDKVEVIHDSEFQKLKRNRKLKDYEYIIVDEVQDFSVQDIMEISNLSVCEIYVFGDDMQQLYETKKDSIEKNLCISELLIQLGMSIIRLEKNHRISQSIVDFISDLFPDALQKTSAVDGKIKVEFKKFSSSQNQLEWIKSYLLANSKEDIGILLRENESNNLTDEEMDSRNNEHC